MSRILIVEDEESFSDPLSYLLRREGYEVSVADDGPAALEEFERNGADLVLLDLMLPGLPGTEVCRRLRSKSNVPVIMLTAKDGEIDKVVGLELGADDYVTKPFSSRELVARMRAVLRRRGRLVRPAEDGADPRCELAQRERLGHVVVGAELEADDLVDLGVLRGEHDDRHRGLGAEDPADLDARELGEHEVEQDEVGSLGPEGLERRATVGGGDGPIALHLEGFDEGLPEGRLVVNDEDRARHSPRIVDPAC